MVDKNAESSIFTKPYISPKHYRTYRFYRFYRFTAYGFLADRRVVQQFVRLFSRCRVAAALRTRVGVVFRTRVAAGRADWAAEGVVRVEKYTARRDLTADGVDFESLCEWTNNYEQWRWYHEQAAPAASIVMMKPATMIQ